MSFEFRPTTQIHHQGTKCAKRIPCYHREAPFRARDFLQSTEPHPGQTGIRKEIPSWFFGGRGLLAVDPGRVEDHHLNREHDLGREP
jgi:hypothetical protein